MLEKLVFYILYGNYYCLVDFSFYYFFFRNMKPFKTDEDNTLKETKLVNIMDEFELDDSECSLSVEKRSENGSLILLG